MITVELNQEYASKLGEMMELLVSKGSISSISRSETIELCIDITHETIKRLENE